jgi:hypothetical protein
MRKLLLIVSIVAILAMIIPFSGCSNITKIGDIIANPLQFEGKEVNVRGYVGDTIWLGILNKGSYQIGDGSDTIWVVTTQPPPQKGVEVSITGTVTTAFKLGDTTLGTVINEIRRD